MIVPLMLPRILERVSDRAMMITAAAMLTLVLSIRTAGQGVWVAVLARWFMLGIAYSMRELSSGAGPYPLEGGMWLTNPVDRKDL